jgi:DNA-binding NarL/FixJ family response regulator
MNMTYLAVRNNLQLLTARELEVLQNLVNGLCPVEIAKELFISVHTARTHVKSILLKMNAHSSLEAVSIAVRNGMLPTPLTA